MAGKGFDMHQRCEGGLAYSNTSLSCGSDGSVLVVEAQPGQQAEDGEGQLITGVSKQGSKAMEDTALPLCLLQYAGAGDVRPAPAAASWQPGATYLPG